MVGREQGAAGTAVEQVDDVVVDDRDVAGSALRLRSAAGDALAGRDEARVLELGRDDPCTVFVASTGGHLAQLFRLSKRIPYAGSPLWVTFESPQSYSLLDGVNKRFVRYTAPRDHRSVGYNLGAAVDIFHNYNVEEVISTGSGVALSFLPVAKMLGIRTHYIESAARTNGPSLTGRVLSRIPGVRLYTQYESWMTNRWQWRGSVFDEFVPGGCAAPPQPDRLNVVVVLGTLSYRFDRLIDAIRGAIRPNWNVRWQVGGNDYGTLPGVAHDFMPAREIGTALESADVVITHSGVGAALAAMDAGLHPILVPREAAHGEHIDDHQRLIAEELAGRGLATHVRPSEVTTEAIAAAARRRVERHGTSGPPFMLQS